MNGHGDAQSYGEQTPDRRDSIAGKRRSEEGSASHTRAKRNRYISIACNECKRRKIKCNGQTPCQRCGNLSLECLYAPNCCSTGSFKDTDEFKHLDAHIQSLQDQVNDLYANLHALRTQSENDIATGQDYDAYRHESQMQFQNMPSPSTSRPPPPRFQGPTSSNYSFDVAKTSLQTMGITGPEEAPEEAIMTQEMTPVDSPRRAQAPVAHMVANASKDPIWTIGKDEALRLCRVYDEEMGIMYPMLDMDQVAKSVNALFKFMESAKRTGLMQEFDNGDDALEDDDTNLLKMILATAMTVEGSGRSILGRRLFESVRKVSEGALWRPVGLSGLKVLVVIAQYYFHLDEEAQAYRVIGLAARMCFEMGLHRRETLKNSFPSEEASSWAVRLFWSIYVLDRRWSFGTGMPFAIQDSDIDPLLPEPDESTPYLMAMISYGRISSKVWHSVIGFESTSNEIKRNEVEYFDYQIQQWQNAIPEPLRYHPSDTSPDFDSPDRPIRRLRVILYLRANQLRILIYRPVLHSATSTMENKPYSQAVVEVAKDTIRVLTSLNQISDIYRAQQVCFNYFLVSALAVLFLAAAHAPIEYSRQVRDEFYMALDLIKNFSTKSYTSKRLWRTIKVLKEVGPKLGLVSRPPVTDTNDPHSSAAVAMAGLAGHRVDEMAIFSPGQDASSLGSSPMNGQQMSRELTTLFEAAGSFGTMMPSTSQPPDGMNGFVGSQGELSQGVEGAPGMFGNEEEFSKIMRNLF